MACASGEGFQSYLNRQRISGRTGNEAGAASFINPSAPACGAGTTEAGIAEPETAELETTEPEIAEPETTRPETASCCIISGDRGIE